MLTNKKIACVAGEPSGDLLGADILSGLKSHIDLDGFEYFGIGGQRMIEVGFRSQYPLETLSVRGYVEALRQLPSILKIRNSLIQQLIQDPPAVYIGIDAPDFNLGIERKCKDVGIPTAHFISPSIWAWRGGRIKGIKKAVDHMLCLFPFEPEIYKTAEIKATYVGHPLASSIPMIPNPQSAKNKLNHLLQSISTQILDDEIVIAVLPGSRHSEIKWIAPGFFKAINLITKKLGKNVRFLIPIAVPALKSELENLRDIELTINHDLRIDLIEGNASLVLEAANVVLIASGTATLEAALWKKPMVISYTVPWLTGQIMKRQGYLPYIGLPNILSKEFVVPELLQEDATPENLANAILDILRNPLLIKNLEGRFHRLHESLKRPTANLVADVIASMVRV